MSCNVALGNLFRMLPESCTMYVKDNWIDLRDLDDVSVLNWNCLKEELDETEAAVRYAIDLAQDRKMIVKVFVAGRWYNLE